MKFLVRKNRRQINKHREIIDYVNIPRKNIVIVKKKYGQFDIYNYFQEIKGHNVKNGKYMIKKYELKYINSYKKIAFNKKYFCNNLITYTYSRKNSDIFYLNNFQKAMKLAKLLFANDPNCIHCVVNRKTGKETYLVSRWWIYNFLIIIR